ncbi:hypothetical protein AUP68_02234 [Ilyonectria robusta]
MTTQHYDTLIVGIGIGGIYQLHTSLQMGLSVKAIDLAGGVGGTWYFNRYPGCMSDTESYLYRYSWDKDDLRDYPWPNTYIKQDEILKYLNHVVDKYHLRQHMQFNTEMHSADWDDESKVWKVVCGTGDVFIARYLVTSLGLLSKQNIPDLPGIDTFRGEITHTAAWSEDIDIINKRVAVVGCGSTGTQVVNAIADKVKSLHVFVRNPQYSVPSGFRPVSAEEREDINQRYDKIWEEVRNSSVGFGFEESTVPCMSVSPEERERIFEDLWQRGNGFRFMFGGFSDIVVSKEANEEACKFVRKKIAQIIKDPKKAAILTPRQYYARRPLCDSGFYHQFNRENVHAVDVKKAPITAITSQGIQTEDNELHEVDVIVFATGFDAIDGNYTRIRIRGRNGLTLKDYWTSGPTAYLGIFVPNFPNLFMINGPNGPFCNIPPAVETSVEFINDTITRAERMRKTASKSDFVVEALPEAESEWGAVCNEAAEGNLFKEMQSWIFGANVPGKTQATRFYFGGLRQFRGAMDEVRASNYRGFTM